MCTILIAPALSDNNNPIQPWPQGPDDIPSVLSVIAAGGSNIGGVLGGYSYTLKGTCFASLNPADWQVYVSDGDGNILSVVVSDSGTTLGITTVYLPEKPGRIDGHSRLNFYVVGTSGSSNTECQCGPECNINYSWLNTPTLETIIPSAANSGSDVFFYGVERVSDPSEITYILIGSANCYFPDNPNDPTEFEPSENSLVDCTTPANEPGYYNVSQRNGLNTGDAWIFDTVHNYKLSTNDYYDFVVIPQISSLSSNLGSYLGQIITITGSGFSSLSTNTVQFSDTNCVISSQTSTQIVCEVQRRDVAVTQTVYHSGLKREQFVGTNHLNIGSATKISSRLDGELYGNTGTFVSKLSGYFQAPVNGNYVFTLAGSSPSYLYFNNIAGAAPTTLSAGTPIAQIGSSTPYRFPWVNSTKTISDPVTGLTAGSFYYFEAYTETYDTEDLSIGVKIPGPANGANQVSTLPDVQKIEASCTYQRLSTVIVINSPDKGGFWYAKFAYTDGEFYTFSYSGQIPYGATATQIVNALGYSANVTVDESQANLGIYTITITFNVFLGVVSFVPTTVHNKPAGTTCSLAGTGASGQATSIIMESPVLSGAFQITDTLANSPNTQVNVQGDATDLVLALRNYGKTPLIRTYKTIQSDYDQVWVFAFYGDHGIQDLVNVVDTSLTGCLGHDPANPNSGSDGIFLNVYKIQDGSTDTYYDAIPNHLLRTAHTTSDSQITVSANGVFANCPGFNCGYAVTTDVCTVTPVNSPVTQSQLSALQLTIGNLEYTQSLANFNKISFAGSLCTGVSYTTLTSTSGLLTVDCQNPALGLYTPQVHLKDFGYCSYQGTSISVDGSITSVTTGNGDNQIPGTGGETVTITGTGFPYGLASATALGLTVTVGTAHCPLISSSSTSIVCQLGAQNPGYVVGGSAPIVLSLGGSTLTYNSLTIQLNTPQLTSVSPTELNPVLQQDITLTGQNFDATDANTQVYLENVDTSDVYECDVKEPASPNTITCFYLGLPSGNYKIYAVTSLGTSNQLDIQILVTMTSISPTSGSLEGGTTLTIGGGIFANDITQTLVYIGPENNYVLCNVISSSTDQVQCVTQPSVWGYTEQAVLVATRIQDEATCGISNATGGCNFQFTQEATPEVTSCSSAGPFNPGDSITYSTLKFGSPPPTVSSQGISLTVASWNSESGSLTVQIPSNFPPVINSSVDIFISGLGYATFTTGTCNREINVSLTLKTVSPNIGPVSGALLTLVGNGFTSLTQVNIGTSNFCEIRTVTPTQITCAAYSAGSITIIDPTYQTPIKCSSGTCSITLSLSAPATPTVSKTGNNLQLSSNGFSAGAQSIRLTSNYDSSVTFDQTGSLAGNTATFDITGLPAGNWNIEVASNSQIAIYSSWEFYPSITSSGTISSSIAGGLQVTLNGNSFSTVASQNHVTVCGLPATVTAANSNSLTISTPPFTNSITKLRFPTLTAYNLLNGIWTGDVQNLVYKVYDNNERTFYVSSSSSCYIQLDVGNGAVADLTQFTYVPAVGSLTSEFDGTIFDGSNDTSTWTTIYNLSNTIDAYNFWTPSTPTTFRYFRVRGNGQPANCNFAEVQFFGYLRSASTDDPTVATNCPVVVNVNGASVTSGLIIDYATSLTPVLYDFSPKFGTSAGGTSVTFTGSNFGANPSVYIDDTPCAVLPGATSTQITCTTAQAPSIADRRNSFESAITISFSNGNAVTNGTAYFYVDLWSSVNTWDGIVPPRDGDSVYIPPGQNVLVDISPNLLNAVVIEGGLFFADGNDVNFNAHYVLIDGGRFQIGTSDSPVSSNVVVTLYGYRSDPSLPIAGNKMIANVNGLIDIHGTEVVTPWTTLASTAAVGATQIVVNGDVQSDWKVGDSIVIASTDFDHTQAEELVIASLSFSNGQTTIELTSALAYSHYAGSQTVQGSSAQTVTFAAEVGLLTRNIVIQGDDTSDVTLHGANIISFSQGSGETVTRISNAEFTRSGQAYLVDSYAVYYRMIGSAVKSYFTGNSIHNSYNRAVTIHATHYLRVLNNVMYDIMGHAVYLEDGVETNNQISGNLVVSVSASRALLLTDTIPSCFYITNPLNTYTNNACGGSDGQGFWFMLPQTSMGASYSPNLCPEGFPLGVFDGNSAHSNVQNGLRIYPEWIPRTNPCQPWVDWTQEANPFAINPPIQANLNNFVTWKNGIDGIAAEKVGAILFNNPIVADNIRAGIEVADGDKANEELLEVNNAIIIGRSNNAGTSSQYCVNGGARGLVLPRTDFFWATGVIFHNFQDCTAAVETCSGCEYGPSSDSGGRTSYLQSIYYSGTVTQKLRFNTPRKDIVVDFDGTFTQTSAGASVTAYWNHLNDSTICPLNSAFDGIICNPTVSLRRVVLWSVGNVGTNDLHLLRVDQSSDLSEPELVANWRYAVIPYRYWRLPMGNYGFVTLVGYTYKYSWDYGPDFTTLYFLRGDTFTGNDYVNLVNNHTAPRETYDVTNYRTTGAVLAINQAPAGWYGDSVATAARTNGDWFHDAAMNLFWTILKAGLNGTFFVEAWGCKFYCPQAVVYPVPVNQAVKQWCDPTSWDNMNVPEDGADVVIIKNGWQMHLGCSTSNVQVLMVYGDFIWDDDGDYNLSVQALWVLGSFSIGNATNPFTHQAIINFWGGSDAASLDYEVVDLNKAILVTGNLEIYASPPSILWSTLTAPITPTTPGRLLQNAYTITILDDVTGIWNLGDLVVIESTGESGYSEEFTIASAPIGNSIVLTSGPSHNHFGDPNPTTLPDGSTIDYRARVGLLTRNVVITAEQTDDWGCTLYITQYANQRGYAYLNGVQISQCGQAGTSFGALQFDSLYSTGVNPSVFQNSSIHDSWSQVIVISSSNLININNNILARASGAGIVLSGNIANIQFNNNWVTGIGVATSNDPNSIYYNWNANFRADGAIITQGTIQNNRFSDCGGTCVSIAGGDCYNNPIGPWTYYNNIIANGAEGLTVGGSTTTCAGTSYWTIFNIKDTAVAAGANAQTLLVNHMNVVDASYGFSLNTGGQQNVTVIIENSYIGGSINNESYYSNLGISCSNRVGIVGGTSSNTGKTLPIWGATSPWRRQYLEGAWYSVVRITGNYFYNWKDNSKTICKNNYIITNNDLAPNSQSIHLFYKNNIVENSVDPDHFVTIIPHETSASLIQRCGGWECTGYNNVIFKDIDGSVTGVTQGLTAFPKLVTVAQPYCTTINNPTTSATVGYSCQGNDWGILAFESLDLDRETRIFSPINVTRPDGFRNDLNTMMMEDANYVNNWVRLSRFYSVIQTDHNYTLNYLGSLPNQMRFQLQGASSDSDWVILRQRYDQPYIISVAFQGNNSVIRSNILGPDGVAELSNTGCGGNYFYGVDQVVEFKLTGRYDCILLTTVTNGVKGRVRYVMDVNSFYANDGPTQFIDRVADVLGINLNTIRVVSVVQGSSIVDFTIATPTQGVPTNEAQQQQINSEISSTINQLKTAISSGQLNIIGTTVLDSSFTGSSASNPTGSSTSSSSSSLDPKIIIIAAALGGLVFIIAAIFIVKRMKKKDDDKNNTAKVPEKFFNVKKGGKKSAKILTRVFPLPKDLTTPSEKAPVITDLESMSSVAEKVVTKVGNNSEQSMRKLVSSEGIISPSMSQIISFDSSSPTKSRKQLKNPFES